MVATNLKQKTPVLCHFYTKNKNKRKSRTAKLPGSGNCKTSCEKNRKKHVHIVLYDCYLQYVMSILCYCRIYTCHKIKYSSNKKMPYKISGIINGIVIFRIYQAKQFQTEPARITTK